MESSSVNAHGVKHSSFLISHSRRIPRLKGRHVGGLWGGGGISMQYLYIIVHGIIDRFLIIEVDPASHHALELEVITEALTIYSSTYSCPLVDLAPGLVS